MQESGPEMVERASRVRVLLLDVDGVLTDGRLHMRSDGSEGRSFHVRDGLGVRMAQRGGLTCGIISGRDSRVVAARAAELDITEIHQGILDKVGCFEKIRTRLELAGEQFCFVGDDLLDLPLMRRIGFAAEPGNAAPEVREAAHYVTLADGGRGAVREVIDLVLRATGKWNQITEALFK